MTTFEFIFALLSVVLGLALTHMLGAVAQLVRAGNRVRFSWSHAAWMAATFVGTIGNWLGLWQLRQLVEWNALSLMGTVLLVVFQYLIAALVTPDVPAEGVIDLKDFARREGRRYVGAMAIFALMMLPLNLIYAGVFDIARWGQDNLFVVPMVGAAVLPLVVRRNWAQLVGGILMLALMSAYLVYAATIMT
ncbi:MAG: hypothetical protein Q8L66_09030 [Caulobacter sp.]|nr:hypothetical protein [Caulobacter sp.]